MRRKNGTAPAAKPAQMTRGQIDRLSRAPPPFDLLGNKPEAVRRLLVIMDEIGRHSFDQSNVETISILMRDHLFAVTPESEEAERKCIAESRARLLAAVAGEGGAP